MYNVHVHVYMHVYACSFYVLCWSVWGYVLDNVSCVVVCGFPELTFPMLQSQRCPGMSGILSGHFRAETESAHGLCSVDWQKNFSEILYKVIIRISSHSRARFTTIP